MKPLYGLIPAAGKGVRARPYTTYVHKGMLEINGAPNIERLIAIMRDDLGISDIFIVLGHLGASIRNHFGNGSKFGVRLRYIENHDLEKGLAWSVYLAHEFIDDYFLVMLCDECYINSNHSELLSFPCRDYMAVCAGMPVEDEALIKRNYAVYTEGNRIARLVEKPAHVDNNIMGSGTFVFSPALFPLLKDAFDRSESGYVEFVTFLDRLVRERHPVGYFRITGTYVNINDRDSLQAAKYHERSRNFARSIVDLLIYAEGDEENVAFTVARYREVEGIHNIYLVLPEGSPIEAATSGAGVSIIRCPPGCVLYGEKLKHAMRKAHGDILILTEADYTFPGRDVAKLLAYLPEADMVIGTRTTRQLIEQGSTMRGLVRLANTWLGKCLEFLWWNREPRCTDVGCTFRAIWRQSFENIADRLHARGPEFSAEMVIELLQDRQRVIEIPVNYFNRSESLTRAYQHPFTVLRFLGLICGKRLKYLFKRG